MSKGVAVIEQWQTRTRSLKTLSDSISIDANTNTQLFLTHRHTNTHLHNVEKPCETQWEGRRRRQTAVLHFWCWNIDLFPVCLGYRPGPPSWLLHDNKQTDELRRSWRSPSRAARARFPRAPQLLLSRAEQVCWSPIALLLLRLPQLSYLHQV